MTFFSRDRFIVEGVMPQRALLRLKRAGIVLFHVKKIQKNQIVFSVSVKDTEKVFAIYPNVCYNISAYTPFTVKQIGREGPIKYLTWLKKRIGLLIGGLLFVILSLFFDAWVFAVDFIGTDVYRRETLIALEQGGITPFSVYRKGEEDVICAQILALDGVAFCSVQKKGFRVVVETRLSSFSQSTLRDENMTAQHTGTVVAMTVLKGTPRKQIGEQVTCGETLVENQFFLEDGGQVRVEPIARVMIDCEFSQQIAATTAEEAFATAYLQLQLSPEDKITERVIEQKDGLFDVKIGYIVIESINLGG